MMTTNVTMPAELLRQLDALAERSGTNRDRLIVEACRELVRRRRRRWSPGFFTNDHLDAGDLELLRGTAAEFIADIESARTRREGQPF